MMDKLKTLIKAAMSGTVTDSGNYRRVNVTYQGKTMQALDVTPYGFFHNPPENSLAIVLSQNGQESNGLAIVDNPNTRTIKDTNPGESGLQNDVTGAFIYLKENGDIVIDAPNDVEVNAVGSVDVTAGGNITATTPADVEVDSENVAFTTSTAFTITIGTMVATFSSSGLSIVNGALSVGGLDFETHIHSQDNDSNGDTEEDTGFPHA